MQLRINGEEHSFSGPLSVKSLIEQLGLNEGPVAVEINREVVPRGEHATHLLSDGDVLEIVHFVGGG